MIGGHCQESAKAYNPLFKCITVMMQLHARSVYELFYIAAKEICYLKSQLLQLQPNIVFSGLCHANILTVKTKFITNQI